MLNVLISIAVFIVVIVIHELAHGYTAYRLGDPTARDAGRLTLNPAAHADPVGTVLLPVLLIAARSPVIFGWAKPVPVDPRNFGDRRSGMFLTSLAGPAANFSLAGVFALLFNAGIFRPYSVPWIFLLKGIMISLLLGIFNLLPIPPLDGAGVLFSVLPAAVVSKMEWLERYGFVVIIAFLYLGVLDKLIFPMVTMMTRVLVG